ncbi:MAG: hypothetical protein RR313_00005 [Anaerovoracaceae bacterium]
MKYRLCLQKNEHDSIVFKTTENAGVTLYTAKDEKGKRIKVTKEWILNKGQDVLNFILFEDNEIYPVKPREEAGYFIIDTTLLNSLSLRNIDDDFKCKLKNYNNVYIGVGADEGEKFTDNVSIVFEANTSEQIKVKSNQGIWAYRPFLQGYVLNVDSSALDLEHITYKVHKSGEPIIPTHRELWEYYRLLVGYVNIPIKQNCFLDDTRAYLRIEINYKAKMKDAYKVFNRICGCIRSYIVLDGCYDVTAAKNNVWFIAKELEVAKLMENFIAQSQEFCANIDSELMSKSYDDILKTGDFSCLEVDPADLGATREAMWVLSNEASKYHRKHEDE